MHGFVTSGAGANRIGEKKNKGWKRSNAREDLSSTPANAGGKTARGKGGAGGGRGNARKKGCA